MFKVNGQAIATINSNGFMYIKGLNINGINILELLNSIIGSLNTTATVYVKHVELKNGTYQLNVDDIITNSMTSSKMLY